MPQRYYTISPSAGANLYQAYTDTVPGSPTILGPSQLAELGVKAGVRHNGNLNTTWMFVNTGTASPVVNAGTAVAVNTSTFLVQTGTSSLNGTGLVGMAASTPGGMWLEVSGATLNLTPASLETEEQAQHRVDEAKQGVEVAQKHLAQAEKDAAEVKKHAEPAAAHAPAATTHAATKPAGGRS